MKFIPVCPVCNEEMVRKFYYGYYDEFHYWACKCGWDDVEVEEEFRGAFVSGGSENNKPEKVGGLNEI